MNPTEELSSLMDDLVAKKGPPSEEDRNVLADWISDHPEMAAELLAALLRQLPGVLRHVARENLAVRLYPVRDMTTDNVNSIAVALLWNDDQISFDSVILKGRQ